MKHLIAGLILVALGAWGIIAWWAEFGAILRGLIPIMLVLVGLAGIGAGVKNTQHEAEREDEDSDAKTVGKLDYPERDRLAG